MTIYEEVYKNIPDLAKFYRFEGYISYPSILGNIYLPDNSSYIYFSGNIKHHEYYVEKRLKQLIREILKDTDYSLTKKAIQDISMFNGIVKKVENYQVTEDLLSIELGILPIINQMIEKNFIINQRKKAQDQRIERVDTRRKGGGYGFCGEWQRVLQLLTFFYSYQRITTENIIDFLHKIRRNYGTIKKINLVDFLTDSQNRVVKLNQDICSDFVKYELMDTLQRIVEMQYYFPNSIFAKDSNEQIKRIIEQYILAREQILGKVETTYKKRLKTPL